MIDDRRGTSGRGLTRADEAILAAFEERKKMLQSHSLAQGRSVSGYFSSEADWLRNFSRGSDPASFRELGNTILKLSRAETRRPTEPQPAAFDRPRLTGFWGDKDTFLQFRSVYEMLGMGGYAFMEASSSTGAPFLKKYEPSGVDLTGDAETRFISSCAYLSPSAKKVGAVTTLCREKDGTYGGYNTDHQAFHFLFHYFGMPLDKVPVLVVTDGSAPAALPVVLREWGALVQTVTGEQLKSDRTGFADAALLIYTGKVGAFPYEGECPVNLTDLPALKGVIDLNCRPYRTKLLLEAERRRIPYVNGLPRLAARCVCSMTVWAGGMEELPPEKQTVELIRRMEDRYLNIVLVGMPGAGKSTQARFLNYMLKRPVYDSDQAFRYSLHVEPGDFFQQYGEEAFRREEAAVIRELGRMNGVILATGGGAVLKEENQDSLRQNGRVVFLSRPVESLSTYGRPLSSSRQKLIQLETERLPIYRSVCDVEISVDENKNGTARRILRALGLDYLASESY